MKYVRMCGLAVLGTFICCAVSGQGKERSYFRNTFDSRKVIRIEPKFIGFDDQVSSDTLYACYASEAYPIAYFREVFTNVCNGGECLPVWIFMYWSAGGAYLGYSLRDDNILTKERHVPFTEEDYRQLHVLLDMPESLLKDYELKDPEPAEPDSPADVSNQANAKQHSEYTFQRPILGDHLVSGWSDIDLDTLQVDGVTSATDKEVQLFVVKGALYTTHTLWHILYGPTRDSIRALAGSYLSKQFLSDMFYSSLDGDNYFAISVLDKFSVNDVYLVLPRLKKIVIADNFKLKEAALNWLSASELPVNVVMDTWKEVYLSADQTTRLMILDRLDRYPELPIEMVRVLTRDIGKANVNIIQKIFGLLQKAPKVDGTSENEIASLLENDNRFISNLAYGFLSSLANRGPELERRLSSYANKQKKGIR